VKILVDNILIVIMAFLTSFFVFFAVKSSLADKKGAGVQVTKKSTENVR